MLAGLCAAIPNPFILLTPAGTSFTPRVDAAIRRHGSNHIPLARFVSLAGPGTLTATAALKPVLAAFDKSLAHRIGDLSRLGSGERNAAEPQAPCGPSDWAGASQRDRRPDEVSVPARKDRYALHKGGGYWTITIDGQEAPKKHEKGLLYVAWLLTNPPKEPIRAMQLVAKVPAIYRRQLGLTSAVDETTGKAVALDAGAMPQERSHAPDDLEVARRIQAKEREWEAILDDEDATEPEKAEALQKLEELVAELIYECRNGREDSGLLLVLHQPFDELGVRSLPLWPASRATAENRAAAQAGVVSSTARAVSAP